MFRSAILRFQLPSLRSAVRPVAVSALRPAPIAFSRTYAAAAGLSKDDISSRVLEVLKSFEKVDGGKLSATATFTKDLGLDSLDAVEVVMAIEEEFGVEIPDAEADEITTVQQDNANFSAIEYIAKTPEDDEQYRGFYSACTGPHSPSPQPPRLSVRIKLKTN